jgi:AraC-like DNA-binding protein
MAVLFDLDRVDAAARTDTLQELMGQLPLPIDVRSRGIDTLHVSTVSDYFGGVFLMSCSGRGALVGRDRARAGQEHDRTLLLSVVARGSSRLQQDDNTADISTGDVVLYSSATPYRATFDNVGKHTFMIRYSDLDLPDRVMHAQLARRLRARDPLPRIVARYLADLATNAVHLPQEQRLALERPTLDLIRTLVTATAGDEFLAREPLNASLGVRMVEYVKMHLTDQDLTIGTVATVHGISERYAYLVLAKSGINLAEWVRTQRLVGAAEELRRPGASAAISDIAFRWGFPDHANFTRSFRRRYGVSPRDYRNASTTL